MNPFTPPPVSGLLPERWQNYASWLDAQENPPPFPDGHPLQGAAQQAALAADFARCTGTSIADYVRLKRLSHLLRHPPAGGSGKLLWAAADSPLGSMLAVFSERGLCLLEFPESAGTERELLAVLAARPGRLQAGDSPLVRDTLKQLAAYFSGSLKDFSLPLDPVGTPFQQQVWAELQRIPYGETRSYLQQAESLGNAKAVRAVAAANGQNKISVIIPCHRVIGSSGTLTGYAGGLERKAWLLAHERRHTAPTGDLFA